MDSSDSNLLDNEAICERSGCGLPGEPVMVHADIKGMVAGHTDDRSPEAIFPGQERILCGECFEAEWDNLVETTAMMSRGELPHPQDDTFNL